MNRQLVSYDTNRSALLRQIVSYDTNCGLTLISGAENFKIRNQLPQLSTKTMEIFQKLQKFENKSETEKIKKLQLFIQFFIFKTPEFLKTGTMKFGYNTLTLAFLYLTITYGLAVFV